MNRRPDWFAIQRRFLASVPRVSASLAIATGMVVLTGWALNMPVLESLGLGPTAMKANAAVGLILTGIALWFAARLTGRIAAAAVVLLAAVTLAEFVAGRDFGIDQLLVVDRATDLPGPGRMALNTALGFLLLGAALLQTPSSSARRRRAAEIASGIVVLLTYVTVVSLLLGVDMYAGGVEPYFRMAWATAFIFGALSVGVVAAVPNSWFVARVMDRGTTGIFVRRLLPIAIGAPIALGWLRLLGQNAGLYDTLFGSALDIVVPSALLFAGVMWSLSVIERTDQKRRVADEALRESEERQRLAVDAAQIGMWFWNALESDLYFTPLCKKLFGLDGDEKMSYARFEAALHPDDRARTREIIQRSWEERTDYRIEHRTVWRDGSVHWLAALGRSHYDANGRGVSMMGVSLDIDDRKRAEQEVAEVQARFRALVEHSWDPIVAFAADGTITYASPAVSRVLGYAVDELLGRSAFELIAPDSREFVAERMKESRRRPGEQVPVHAHLLAKNGSWRLFEGIFTNLLDEPGVRGIVTNMRDVTDQRRTEEQVRLLTLAVEQGPAAVLITDRSGKIDYVNQKFTEDTGYAMEEVRGKNASLLSSDLTPLTQYEQLWKTILSGNVYHGEIQNRKKSGMLFWNDVQVSPVRNDAGEITHFLGVQTDITDRKLTDEALRESNDRFRQLAENIHEVFFLIDAQFRETLYINSAYETIWGRSRESLYENPRSFLDLVPADDRVRLLAYIGAIQRGEDPGVIEFRAVKPDGDVRWVLAKGGSIRDANGEVYRLSGIALDITERRAAQAQLEESLGRFRAIVDASFDAITIAQDGIIRDVNKGFLKTFGVERVEDAVGRSVLDFVADESRAGVAQRVELNVDGADEIVGKRTDGKKILLETTSKTHTMDGRPVRITAVRDVTESRALQQQFLQSQKMEAIGQLAGGVAHDFNNLLTVIKSYGAFLLEDTLGEADRRDSVEQIVSAADRAATLTRQLLAFSRRQLLDPKVLNLNAVVTDIEKMLRRVVTERIAFRTALHEPLGTVRADAGQIEQVIVNLAVNARDAMPSGGELIVATANVEVSGAAAVASSGQRPGRWVMIRVSDTGTGIDEATRARIFEPFFTTKERGMGTGLGLSTTQGIVEQSGGYVRVESEVGRGSTFEVYLPRLDIAAERRADEVTGPKPLRGTERVLVVEDEASVRLLVTRMLTSFGYTVLEARDGREALGLALKLDVPPDLVLTDIVMPRMSGREMIAALRERWPAVRVLFMSGYSEQAVADPAVFASNAVFIAKPFRPKQLLRKVRDTLDTPWSPAP
jgi:PAS domain S-box-containing protein